MRVQTMSRWPMCQMPSAPLMRWWIWRSRMDSKSFCILRPATSTRCRAAARRPPRRVDVGADDVDLAVLDLVHLAHADELEGGGDVAAELDVHVVLADPLALEGRAVGDGDRDLGDLDLARRGPRCSAGFSTISSSRERRGDDVLVGADAGGQDLRDVGVGDDGEAQVDRAGGGGVLEVVDLAERQHEGEHPVLVVEQDLARVAGVHAAEGERRAGGEPERVDGGDGVDAERHGEGVVAQLDALLLQAGG